MLELDFINIDQEKVRKIKDKAIERIYLDEEMRIFIEENKLPRSFIYENLSDFIKVLENRKLCKNCQGLKLCSKNGCSLDLEIDKINLRTNVTFSSCKLLRKRRNIYNKFIICSCDQECFDYELKDCTAFFKEDRKLILKTLATIIKENSNRGVYLYGEKGIGKSFLMGVFAKHLVNKREGHFVYIDARDFIPSMVRTSFNKDKEDFKEDLELLKTVDYLFIDNFGEEEKNDFSKESIILEVLTYRKDNSLPTYITSIHSISSLYSAYRTPKSGNYKTKDIISCIEETCEIVSLPTSSRIATGIFKK